MSRLTYSSWLNRRQFLRGALATSGGLLFGCARERTPAPMDVRGATSAASSSPAIVTPDPLRPALPYGVQAGEITSLSAVVWSKCDRPARLVVEWSADEGMQGAARVEGPFALPASDCTARVELVGLPPGRRIHYRASFEDGRARSEPVTGSFRTAPEGRADVLFAWSGDTAGQGWGIDASRGGMKTYETIRRMSPHFFLHCGDMIYADAPIPPRVRLADGSFWQNLTTAAKSKVAETLDEFRGAFAYNLLDANVRRFNAEIATLVMWDDHEIHNNWYPGQELDDPRYTIERRASILAERARQAMFEYTPIRALPNGERRVYRSFRHGPSLEVFLLDERSYRGPNSMNRQRTPCADAAFLGREQLEWLKLSLASSTATWKVIATDMPLGLIVPDGVRGGEPVHEGWANGAGPPLGRELELAELFKLLKERRVRNTVWLTADVHYAAAHYYDPKAAEFADFLPFWEFVAGPLHAGTYGPNELDPTFGPQLKYQSRTGRDGLVGPADGGQYFGAVKIDGKSEAMTVSLFDVAGTKLYGVELTPER